MKPDYHLVNLPNGMSLTFIGTLHDVDPETVELCTPDGRPVLSVPRSCVTPTTREETAQRLHDEIQDRRAQLN